MELMTGRLPGKILTYLGLFLTGAGMIGILGPHMDLQRSGKVMAEVVANDLAYHRDNTYAFRLQLRWTKADGEQRTTITTPVKASSEQEARSQYRGRGYAVGQTYEIYTSAQDPDRVEPFKGYNASTFGKWLAIAIAGFVLFFAGMSTVRRAKDEKPV
jgi:hypothetical protein